MIDTFLFDLDGTLVDTAPDLTHAVNAIRRRLGLQPISLDLTRPIAGNGAKALIQAGNDIHQDIDSLAQELFEYYKHNIHVEAHLFEGMEEVLKNISKAGSTWGIVTNRPGFLTHALLPHLNLPITPAVVVCGDTLSRSKPHPDPVIHAYTLLKKLPAQCVMIGDSSRDIQAGKAAGVKTVAALYGYIEAQDDPTTWAANYTINHAKDLNKLFELMRG